MGEKQKYVVKRFGYEGLLNYKDLFRIIDLWQREKFYDKFEHRSEEFQMPEGKQIEFEFKPWKKVTDYHKIIIKIELLVTKLRDVEVEHHGKKIKMQHGKVDGKLTGYMVVDYEHKWNAPFWYFLRDLYDKYVYTAITKKYYNMVLADIEDLSATIQNYLNTQPYRQG